MAGDRTITPASVSEEAIPPEVWRIVFVVILGGILVILDTTIVNVALEPLTRELHTDLRHMQWVVTGYLLAIAAVIPLTAWAGRRYSPKRLYLVSMAVFTIGSALCGLSQSVNQLIFFRVIQGIGGGALPPVGQMIMVRASGPKNLPRVMATYGVPTILAPIFGPTIGGLLIQQASWRTIFVVNVPLGIVAVIAGMRRLPDEPSQRVQRYDLASLVLVVAGLVAITYGLSELQSAAGNRGAYALVLGAVALLAAFVVRSTRIANPLLDMRVYGSTLFSGAAVATFFLGMALVGNSILMPLYLQGVRGQDALAAGLLVAPRGVGAALGTWLSGRMMSRLGTGRTALIGTAGVLVFTVPFIAVTASTSYTYIISVGLVQGCAIGISIMPAMTAGYRALHEDLVADATPQLNILQRIGSSIAVAILIGVLSHGLEGARTAGARADAFSTTYLWLVAVTLPAVIASAVLAVLERRHRARPGELEEAALEAMTQAFEA